jgi:hypothetical protein
VKRLIATGLMALVLVLSSQQQALAWRKCSFSAGISWHVESGNNNFLWGLFKNGQVPGYPTDVLPTFQGVAYPNPYAGIGPVGPVFGGPPPVVAPLPPVAATQQPAPPVKQAIYYNNYNYQAVGYNYPANNSYANQTPGYSYPQYNYSNYQVPSYWYGN